MDDIDFRKKASLRMKAIAKDKNWRIKKWLGE
jgi:hypothetical protein